jgi:hypothetical protein
MALILLVVLLRFLDFFKHVEEKSVSGVEEERCICIFDSSQRILVKKFTIVAVA